MKALKKSDYILLTPDNETEYLTQAINIPDSERLFGKEIYIGLHDDINEWRDATVDEYNEFNKKIILL